MTVEEVLRQSGFTNEQIAALEPKTISAFNGVLSEAQQAREQAEVAQRNYTDLYENRIVPSLTAWDEERARIDNESARLKAEAAYYRTQAEEAKRVGFIPADAPGYQPRDNQGRYIAGAPGSTPGSPTFQQLDMDKIYARAGTAITALADIEWQHKQLYGAPLPIPPTELIARADAVKLPPAEFARREFHWDEKRQELQQAQQKEHDDKVRREATAERDKYWSERVGNNPDIRAGVTSRYADMQRAQRAGNLPDPLSMNEQQRRTATAVQIRKDIAEGDNAA